MTTKVQPQYNNRSTALVASSAKPVPNPNSCKTHRTTFNSKQM